MESTPASPEQTAAGPTSPPPRVPVTSGRVVTGIAVLWTVLAVGIGVLATVTSGDMQEAVWTTGLGVPALVLVLLQGLVGLLGIPALTAVAFWLYGIREVADRLRPDAYQRRSGYWAVIGWIVPIVNLWFPYQVLTDSARALRAGVRTYLPWWIAWLLVSNAALYNLGGDLASPEQIRTWVIGLQVQAVLTLVAGVLWVRVVRATTAAARQAVAEYAGGTAVVEASTPAAAD